MDRPYWHVVTQRWALEQAALDDLKATDSSVLAVLCMHADDEGVSEVTRDRLARLTRLHPQTVKVALRTLRERGYVTHPFGPARTRRELVLHRRPSMSEARGQLSAGEG